MYLIINEPAVALAYNRQEGWRWKECVKSIYLGSGTFDASILTIKDGTL